MHFVSLTLGHEKIEKQPVGNRLIVQYSNNWMRGTKQPLSFKEVYYHMSYLNFSWQMLKWKEYALSQLTIPVWKVTIIFTMTVEKLEAFLMILLVSVYAGLPRQEMYWESREDFHNLVVLAVMMKTEFLECKWYLHLPDNNALNSSDKFAKARALFNAINEQCILN